MTESDLEDQIAGARAYENLHVPSLFKQWCGPVLDAADIKPGLDVLDVGCGTGVLAREASTRTGSSGRVAGVDPGPGMLAVAKELAPELQWDEGVAESLPYPDRSFDAVVSQFSMMFFSDRAKALQEMSRVLKPEGKLAVAVWDKLENTRAFPQSVDLLRRMAGEVAAEALAAPFVLGDRNELRDLFNKAGVASLNIRTLPGKARFPSIRVMVEADLRGWLPVMGVFLSEEAIQNILDTAEVELADYATEGGEMVFDVPAHIITGSRI